MLPTAMYCGSIFFVFWFEGEEEERTDHTQKEKRRRVKEKTPNKLFKGKNKQGVLIVPNKLNCKDGIPCVSTALYRPLKAERKVEPQA